MINKIQSSSVSYGNKGNIIIYSFENPKRKYLYNDVLKLVKKNQVSANFKRDEIEISPSSEQQKTLKKELNKLNIKYSADTTENETKQKQNPILIKLHSFIEKFVDIH